MIKIRNTELLRRLAVAGGAVALAVGFCSLDAHATGFVYQFNNVFYGSTPGGTAPWVDATFQDTANGVLLTVDNPGLNGKEFLQGLYLNINPADNSMLNKLTFSFQSGIGGFLNPTVQTGVDAFQADGDGKYDILFNFATANNRMFGVGESVTYLISGIAGLKSSDFQFLSTPAGGNGPFTAAAEIQGVPCSTGNMTGWINPGAGTSPVPEPASASLIMMCAGALGARRLWLRRS